MKIILTGSTGVIGSEVLNQCIQHTSITSIVVLSRRALPPTTPPSSKLQVVIHDDCLSYPASLLSELSGAQACIWAQGGIPQKFPDLATAKKVNIDYPYAAAQSFICLLGPELRSKNAKFRFLYVSGKAADRDLEKQHRWFHDARHIKGVIETKLLELESENADVFKAYLPRPGSVIPRNSMLMTMLGAVTRPIYPDLKVEELAAAMIEVAVNGGYDGEGENTILHEELQTKGRELFCTTK